VTIQPHFLWEKHTRKKEEARTREKKSEVPASRRHRRRTSEGKDRREREKLTQLREKRSSLLSSSVDSRLTFSNRRECIIAHKRRASFQVLLEKPGRVGKFKGKTKKRGTRVEKRGGFHPNFYRKPATKSTWKPEEVVGTGLLQYDD